MVYTKEKRSQIAKQKGLGKHIRDDNRIENLECISKKEHVELHWKERRGD